MPDRLLALLTIALVALGVSPLGAQPDDDGFALEVRGGAAVLERLGLTEAERGTALVLLARGLHGVTGQMPAGSLTMTVAEVLGPPPLPGMARAARPSPPVPVDPPSRATIRAPMSERTWRRVLGLGERDDLFRALVHDRGALLVAAGALESGPGVQAWLESRPRTLEEIVRRWPGAFAIAAAALALEGDRWKVPGGPALAAAWTALAGAPPARADDFLRRLLAKDGGRLARFYATLSRLDDEWLAAVTAPLPGEDATRALVALYALARDAEPPADPNTHPFQLGYGDLASVLLALDDLAPSRLPAAAGRWATLLETRIESRDEAAAVAAAAPSPQPVAAVVRSQLRGTPRMRRDHVTMVALARRVWRGDEAAQAQAEAIYALAHYPRFRGLLLMLDRIGIADAGAWALAVEAARLIEDGPGRERVQRLDLYQGALALVERATIVGSLDVDAATRVLRSMATRVMAAPIDVAVRGWLLDAFIPALPPLVRPDRFSGRTAYESRVLQALAGPPDGEVTPLEWEGLPYEVDVTAAEHDRLVRLRTLLPSPGLDAALEGDDAAALATALRTLAYVPAMGDPDGDITLSPDVVERHDYGGHRSMPGRDVAWVPAQERTGTGAPWHALGSLLGLDLAFSRLALRRLSADDMPPVPTINLNDQLSLTRTAVALRTAELTDTARDELAAAIARGRARVREAAADAAALLGLGRAAGWTAAEQAAWRHGGTAGDDPLTRFSLGQLLAIGEPALDRSTLDRWGIVAEALDGRLTTRMDRPRPWHHVAGRSDTGMLATQVPDLTLRLVEVTAARRLPARLIPALLLYATQDYWHDVEARFADDWPAMVRGAVRLPATRVEDYVAALATGGPLRGR